MGFVFCSAEPGFFLREPRLLCFRDRCLSFDVGGFDPAPSESGFGPGSASDRLGDLGAAGLASGSGRRVLALPAAGSSFGNGGGRRCFAARDFFPDRFEGGFGGGFGGGFDWRGPAGAGSAAGSTVSSAPAATDGKISESVPRPGLLTSLSGGTITRCLQAGQRIVWPTLRAAASSR